jgi:uncharacterized phage protein (TIGR02218 family)
MRNIPVALAASLASGVTTLANVWLITRRDAQVFAFTDHDQLLPFDALMCEPISGLSAGATEKSLGLGVDSAGVIGALSSEAVTEQDLALGLWDGARVELYRVDWTDTAQRAHVFAGRIGEVQRGAQAFEAELRGLQAPLNVAVGRVFSRFCDADLSDARCDKDIETSVFRGTGVVTALLMGGAFGADGLEAFAEGWFTRGRLVWSAGGENEVAAHRVEGGDAVLELLDLPGPALALSAAFTVYAGCDKRFETCRAKFANTLNFRGYPHMPGNDVVQSRPVAGEPLDGSSRFS